MRFNFAVQRKEWMHVGSALEANLAFLIGPGNEILDSHGVFSFDGLTSAADGASRKSAC
jgi:hypothetical protein